MKYKSISGKYKYELTEQHVEHVFCHHTGRVVNAGRVMVELFRMGTLYMGPGYRWDGATCAPDVRSSRRGVLVHDALYQLIRTGSLPREVRILADKAMHIRLLEDGMSRPMAWIWYRAVRAAGWAFVGGKR